MTDLVHFATPTKKRERPNYYSLKRGIWPKLGRESWGSRNEASALSAISDREGESNGEGSSAEGRRFGERP